ncbi:hypothetical protein GJ633_09415 [Halorubrum sp. CBA1125]|uniref:hypothetical protein n=1 Tax=Halorubrum sp. CBA1125 TaxID=2668072 RepID=UPI0012E946A8|nr:hypothetical protein [Halorubrum sp. CBA1125]MUW14858.1 hypothetical protein [Halorubrum sp. CBA1125]
MSVGLESATESDDDEHDEVPPCAAPSCWRDAKRWVVDGREAILCNRHAKTFLGVSS